MKFKPNEFRKNNYFILYDSNDEVICYFDNFRELSKYINYRPNDLAKQFNKINSNIITIIIENKMLRLATFC